MTGEDGTGERGSKGSERRLNQLLRDFAWLLERAGREPRLGTIVKLARALKVAPADLLEGIR